MKDTVNFFTKASNGLLSPAVNHSPKGYDDSNSYHVYNMFQDNFDRHINASIPMFMETQLETISSIVKNYNNALVMDIGSSNSTWCKSLSYLKHGLRTVAIDPNASMHSQENYFTFDNFKIENKSFAFECCEKDVFTSDEKFDIIHESMTFQFISNDNNDLAYMVKEVSKMLATDGIFLTEGKFNNSNIYTFADNEFTKNAYKFQYFNSDDVHEKNDEIIQELNDSLVQYNDYIRMLQNNFKHVVLYFRSGNFRGLACGNDPEKINKFIDSTNGYIRHNEFNNKEIIEPDIYDLSNPAIEQAFNEAVRRHTRCLQELDDKVEDIDIMYAVDSHSFAYVDKKGELKGLLKNQSFINDGYHDNAMTLRISYLGDKPAKLVCYDFPVLVEKNEKYGFSVASRYEWDDDKALSCVDNWFKKPDILVMTNGMSNCVIEDDTWDDLYDPVLDESGYSIVQLDDYEDALNFVFDEVFREERLTNSDHAIEQWNAKLPYRYVWTLVEGDSGEPVTINGLRSVNRLCYYVCRNPWGSYNHRDNDSAYIEVLN